VSLSSVKVIYHRVSLHKGKTIYAVFQNLQHFYR